jgi:hypothetical protein
MWDILENMLVYKKLCELFNVAEGLPFFFNDKEMFFNLLDVYGGKKLQIGKNRVEVELLKVMIKMYKDRENGVRDSWFKGMSSVELKRLKQINNRISKSNKEFSPEFKEWCKIVNKKVGEILKKNKRKRKEVHNSCYFL